MSTNETNATNATNEAKMIDPLDAKARSGVSWFYWIAGLSVVNSIVAATGSTWGFMAGLGMTQVIDAIGIAIGPAAKFVALALDLVVAGLFVGLGVWATRSTAGYLTGMIIYALDAIIFAVAGDWIGLAFHGLVLFFLWSGFQARREMDRRATTPASEVPLQKAA